jgi:outer membrane immunogenic protein
MAKLAKLAALTTGILGLLGASAPASADGYAGRGYAAPFSWNGYYVGINGGYGFAGDSQAVTNTETVQANPVTVTATGNFGELEIAGGFGGLQIGANHQFGRWVLGLEADAQWSGISDDSFGHINNWLPGGLNADVWTRNRVAAFGTVRPRIGWAFDRTLVYATGGLAWGQINHSFLFLDNFNFRAFEKQSTTEFGWVVGAGIEHAFTSRLSLKLEYQYIDLGSHTYSNPLTFTAANIPTVFRETTTTETDFHTVRVGLNYKFNDRRELVPLK